jgi:hypothetical protein
MKRLMGQKINEAVNIALKFGDVAASYHKQWVIDQMLRVLLDKDYDKVIDDYNLEEGYTDWDKGIEP